MNKMLKKISVVLIVSGAIEFYAKAIYAQVIHHQTQKDLLRTQRKLEGNNTMNLNPTMGSHATSDKEKVDQNNSNQQRKVVEKPAQPSVANSNTNFSENGDNSNSSVTTDSDFDMNANVAFHIAVPLIGVGGGVIAHQVLYKPWLMKKKNYVEGGYKSDLQRMVDLRDGSPVVEKAAQLQDEIKQSSNNGSLKAELDKLKKDNPDVAEYLKLEQKVNVVPNVVRSVAPYEERQNANKLIDLAHDNLTIGKPLNENEFKELQEIITNPQSKTYGSKVNNFLKELQKNQPEYEKLNSRLTIAVDKKYKNLSDELDKYNKKLDGVDLNTSFMSDSSVNIVGDRRGVAGIVDSLGQKYSQLQEYNEQIGKLGFDPISNEQLANLNTKLARLDLRGRLIASEGRILQREHYLMQDQDLEDLEAIKKTMSVQDDNLKVMEKAFDHPELKDTAADLLNTEKAVTSTEVERLNYFLQHSGGSNSNILASADKLRKDLESRRDYLNRLGEEYGIQPSENRVNLIKLKDKVLRSGEPINLNETLNAAERINNERISLQLSIHENENRIIEKQKELAEKKGELANNPSYRSKLQQEDLNSYQKEIDGLKKTIKDIAKKSRDNEIEPEVNSSLNKERGSIDEMDTEDAEKIDQWVNRSKPDDVNYDGLKKFFKEELNLTIPENEQAGSLVNRFEQQVEKCKELSGKINLPKIQPSEAEIKQEEKINEEVNSLNTEIKNLNQHNSKLEFDFDSKNKELDELYKQAREAYKFGGPASRNMENFNAFRNGTPYNELSDKTEELNKLELKVLKDDQQYNQMKYDLASSSLDRERFVREAGAELETLKEQTNQLIAMLNNKKNQINETIKINSQKYSDTRQLLTEIDEAERLKISMLERQQQLEATLQQNKIVPETNDSLSNVLSKLKKGNGDLSSINAKELDFLNEKLTNITDSAVVDSATRKLADNLKQLLLQQQNAANGKAIVKNIGELEDRPIVKLEPLVNKVNSNMDFKLSSDEKKSLTSLQQDIDKVFDFNEKRQDYVQNLEKQFNELNTDYLIIPKEEAATQKRLILELFEKPAPASVSLPRSILNKFSKSRDDELPQMLKNSKFYKELSTVDKQGFVTIEKSSFDEFKKELVDTNPDLTGLENTQSIVYHFLNDNMIANVPKDTDISVIRNVSVIFKKNPKVVEDSLEQAQIEKLKDGIQELDDQTFNLISKGLVENNLSVVGGGITDRSEYIKIGKQKIIENQNELEDVIRRDELKIPKIHNEIATAEENVATRVRAFNGVLETYEQAGLKFADRAALVNDDLDKINSLNFKLEAQRNFPAEQRAFKEEIDNDNRQIIKLTAEKDKIIKDSNEQQLSASVRDKVSSLDDQINFYTSRIQKNTINSILDASERSRLAELNTKSKNGIGLTEKENQERNDIRNKILRNKDLFPSTKNSLDERGENLLKDNFKILDRSEREMFRGLVQKMEDGSLTNADAKQLKELLDKSKRQMSEQEFDFFKQKCAEKNVANIQNPQNSLKVDKPQETLVVDDKQEGLQIEKSTSAAVPSGNQEGVASNPSEIEANNNSVEENSVLSEERASVENANVVDIEAAERLQMRAEAETLLEMLGS